MEIKTERRGATLVAMPEGRIDGRNAADFQDSLYGAIDGADDRVVLDLADVDYISSAGLRAVVHIASSLDRRNARLDLCTRSAPLRQVLDSTGYDSSSRSTLRAPRHWLTEPHETR